MTWTWLDELRRDPDATWRELVSRLYADARRKARVDLPLVEPIALDRRPLEIERLVIVRGYRMEVVPVRRALVIGRSALVTIDDGGEG